jgi:hypothetical protein
MDIVAIDSRHVSKWSRLVQSSVDCGEILEYILPLEPLTTFASRIFPYAA